LSALSIRGGRHLARFIITLVLAVLAAAPVSAQPVHTTYLWHMHQPIYWPDQSTWTPNRYETAYETITLAHAQNDVFSIFNKDDRVADYQNYPKDAIASILDLPDAGAQVSFAAALVENIQSLADAGWNSGRYAPAWYNDYRTARGWTTSGGNPRLDPVLVAAHHPIAPLMDENALRMEIEVAKAAYAAAWGDNNYSKGYFPAEMCFSQRMIPTLAGQGIEWVIVGDTHISRACADYPYQANEDNCDPPNKADQLNPAQGNWHSQSISRGVTVKTPAPFGFRPHIARYVDPATGHADSIVVVPAANAMGWNEGYGLYGTGEIDAVAGSNDPSHPMLILFAHDGDNAWAGGYSYYNENVTGFAHAAASQGYEPTTIQDYLDDHPVDPGDVVHVEDGGWINADGDFGSPQFINWNWPLVDAGGNFDIPGGWAEDERNWAVLTAAQNRVETAQQMAGGPGPDPAEVYAPTGSATGVEKAWHHLLSGYESGYMYYGTSLDMEIKATLAANAAVAHADPLIAGSDATAPTVWTPQRLPWNPGGFGGGSLWGYPGGDGAPMTSDFWVWTFAYDVSGLSRVELMYRIDNDGDNPMASDQNETYAGGPDVGVWQTMTMNHRDFPDGNFLGDPGIDFTVLPDYIADEYYVQVTGLNDVLVDYFVEAEDGQGNVKRTPIQHVWVGAAPGGGGSSHVIDGQLDDGLTPIAASGELKLYADFDGENLYVAMEGVGASTDRDHFVLLGLDLTAPVGACWSKSGAVAGRTLFLGNEDSNNWCGWFDGGEGVITTDVSCASGGFLEGLVTLETWLGSPPPDGVYLAATGYASPDGGALEAQAPSGNADGDVDAEEYVYFPLVVSAAPARAPAAPVLRPAYPNPFSASTRIEVELPGARRVSAAVYNVRGRRVATLAEGFVLEGTQVFDWDGRDMRGRELPSGIYFVGLSSRDGMQTRKIVLVR
jgi:hypothetical protein